MILKDLVAGDLLIEGETNNATHTMMYVGSNANGLPGPSIVDAWKQGVAVWSVETDQGLRGAYYFLEEERLRGREVHIYRREHATVPSLATAYALQWARHQSRTLMAPDRRPESRRALGEKGKHEGKKITDTRRIGVTLAQGEAFAPPFEYDAFYRVLKWALRAEAPFSANRGTTCCAFVTACYQAAAMFDAVQSADKAGALNVAMKKVEQHRKDKTIFTTKDLIESKGGNWLSPGATRASNPGFRGNEQFKPGDAQGFIRQCLCELTGDQGASVETLLTPAMLVDAKYLHSNKLSALLNGADTKGGWVHLGLLTAA